MLPRNRRCLLLLPLAALLAAVLALSGCSSGKPEAEQPDDADRYAPSLDGPLRVMSASPHGAMASMTDEQTIAVTFSKPMVVLGEAPDAPADAFSIEPSLPGSYQWRGTQTLVFVPRAPLPRATAFRVRLTADVRALDGDALAEPFAWSFQTPRPTLERATPHDGEDNVALRPTVRLRFNQPLDTAAAHSYVHLRRGAGEVPFALRAAKDGRVLVMTPEEDLRRSTRYDVGVEEGLPGRRGPLGMAEAQTVSFTTHDAPEFVGVQDADAHDPRGDVALVFRTPVAYDAVLDAVSFSPAAPWKPGYQARGGYDGEVLHLPVELKPETRYTVSLDGLEDVFGQAVPARQHAFRTTAYKPELTMKGGMMVIEADQEPRFYLEAVNVGEVKLGFERLSPREAVRKASVYDDGRYRRERDEALESVAATRTHALDLPQNEPGVASLAFDSLLTGGPGGRTGLIGMTLEAPALQDPERDHVSGYRALAQVTNLGVTAKFSPHRSLVFVSRLADAQPVGGAKVEIRDEDGNVYWRGATGPDGRAAAPGWARLGMERGTHYVFAEKDGDRAFISSRYDDGLAPYRFGVDYDWQPDERTQEGVLFTDRGLYKAGETVHLKAMLRQKTDADWSPLTDSVQVLIRSPRDEYVVSRRFGPSAQGTFDFTWTVPEGAAQGQYQMQVVPREAFEEDGNAYYWDRRIADGDFRVDAFRAASFAVDASTPAGAYVAGDFFEGRLAGRYLFGTPMGGAEVSYRLQRSDGNFRPPGHDGYRFTPVPEGYVPPQALVQSDTVLSADGTLQRRLQVGGTEEGAPATLTWSGTVTDPSGQAISGRTRLTLHPGQFYVGLKPATTLLDLGDADALALQALTVDPNGVPVGGEDVAVRLVRIAWNSAREVGADGRLRWKTWRTEDTVAVRRLTTQPEAPSALELPVEKGGYYEIQATARDVRGNVIRSTAPFYATGGGYVAWRRDDDDRIDVVPERDTYAPGETATLLVKNPYEKATALVTVEREGVLSSRTQTLTGSAPKIEIPLTEKHLPNVFVSVMLFQGRTAPPEATKDPGRPSFKIGYASLRVDADRRHLRVAVEPEQDTYRPGEEAVVRLRLTDAAGRGVPNGEVAFSAADAGVLNLVGYALPDPFETFYGPRPLGVTTSEMRAYLIEQRDFGQKTEALGGGGGGADSETMREDFRPLAHWNPAVRTDGDGRATVRFTLPERLTTYRLMAAAMAGNRFGQGQADLRTQQPLMLQPALPRFARLEDEFEAGVLVTNATGKAGEVTVTAAADSLALRGTKKKTVRLGENETKEVRFAWTADRVGTPALTFRAALGGERDALRATLPVERPLTKNVSATFASTTGEATEGVQAPAEHVPGLGGLRVQLSGTALTGLDGAARYLFGYPYGCLEQRTSRIRPLLLADDLLNAFDLKVLSDSTSRDAEVQKWLGVLGDYWTGAGFSLWAGENRRHDYLSAYVVLAMAEAADAGYTVPPDLRADALSALAERARHADDKPSYLPPQAWNDTRALMLYALARNGRVLSDEIDQLAQRVRSASDPAAAALSVEGVSHLLRAIVAADEPALAPHRTALAERLRRRVRTDAQTAHLDAPQDEGYGWLFGASDTRATAFGLSALAEARGGAFQPLAQRMTRYLMNTRHGGHWTSTHDNAAVVDAFGTYFAEYEEAAPNFTAEVKMAGRTLLSAPFRGRSLRTATRQVPTRALPGGGPVRLTFGKQGRGRLYYAAQLTTYSTEPQPAAQHGLRVERTLQKLDGRGTPTGPVLTPGLGQRLTLRSGDRVKVTLRVASADARHYVAVDDALPAGLEPVNTAFETADPQAQQSTGPGDDRWWGGFDHTEMRDDRVLLFADYLSEGAHTYSYVARATTAGTFVHPPARAEMMYEPATSGRTATGTLVVQPPAPSTAQR